MSYEFTSLRGVERPPAIWRIRGAQGGGAAIMATRGRTGAGGIGTNAEVPRMYERPEYTGLGFSLKPPKWVRKMPVGKFLKKAAIPLAIGAAIIAIPGAAPLLGRGIMAAGRVVGIGKAKSLLPVGALKAAGRAVGIGKPRSLLPVGALKAAGKYSSPLLTRRGVVATAPAPSMPILTTDLEPSSPATTVGNPPFTPTVSDMAGATVGGGSPGGGGGAAPGGLAPAPMEEKAAPSGPNPLLIGGLALLGLMAASGTGTGRRSRRR